MAAGKDGAKPIGESAEAEIVGEVKAGRQSHAWRVGIDFPWVYREHGGLTTPVDPIDRVEHPPWRAHA
jgi:hypothetical protein